MQWLALRRPCLSHTSPYCWVSPSPPAKAPPTRADICGTRPRVATCPLPFVRSFTTGAVHDPRSPSLLRPLLTSRSAVNYSPRRYPFRLEARSPRVRFIDCLCTSAGSTLPDLWSRELCGQLPAHPGRPRLISGFCSSPHRSRSPLLSAILSRSSPCGSLGSLRPTSQRTSTSESIMMLGTHLLNARCASSV